MAGRGGGDHLLPGGIGARDGLAGGLKTKDRRQPVVLVAVVLNGGSRVICEEHLDELGLLAETAGCDVRARIIQDRGRPEAATLLGRGKVAEVARATSDLGARRVIFDDDLSPQQVVHLEEAFGVPVMDRSGLILDVFASRARSRESRTQVELAALRYLLPRLAGRWSHLSRQDGAIGVRGGVGEKQIETDRRLIGRRIDRLETELARIVRRRRVRRRGRRAFFSVALVGYTNSGKSSLFNTLTRSSTPVGDRLFATLDPLVRRLAAPGGGDTVVTDTVGFIRKLPHHLVASFRSTLEEAGEADLLLQVVDAADPRVEEKMDTTRTVLGDLGLDSRPRVPVFNKMDRPEAEARRGRLARLDPSGLFVSAWTGEGIEALRRRITQHRSMDQLETEVEIEAGNAAALAALHRHGRVLQVIGGEGRLRVRYRATRDAAGRIQRALRAFAHG